MRNTSFTAPPAPLGRGGGCDLALACRQVGWRSAGFASRPTKASYLANGTYPLVMSREILPTDSSIKQNNIYTLYIPGTSIVVDTRSEYSSQHDSHTKFQRLQLGSPSCSDAINRARLGDSKVQRFAGDEYRVHDCCTPLLVHTAEPCGAIWSVFNSGGGWRLEWPHVNLRQKRIHGYQVLATLSQLPVLFKKTRKKKT